MRTAFVQAYIVFFCWWSRGVKRTAFVWAYIVWWSRWDKRWLECVLDSFRGQFPKCVVLVALVKSFPDVTVDRS
jgi:hypothetical protein